jgi:NADH pyrophosphatase NudC (nudix superfamily)
VRHFRVLAFFDVVTAVSAWIGFVALSLGFSLGLFRKRNRRCPRCGQDFFRSKWGYFYTATRCFSCGFPTPDDLVSLHG